MVKQIGNPFPDLIRNIWSGCRLSFFVPISRSHFRISVTQAFLLLILAVGMNLVYDFIDSMPNNRFNVYGLNYQATLYLLFIFSIVVIAGIKQTYGKILPALVMILSITPVTFLAYICLFWLLGKLSMVDYHSAYWTIFLVYLAWYMAIVLRALNMIFHPTPAQGAAYLAVYALFNIVPWFALPNTPLWYVPVAENIPESRDTARINIEDIFYSQQKMIEADALRLLEQRPGIVDLYFLGFSAFADEDVFMQEAQHVKKLFDERFETRGRSMLLVNNVKTLNTLPLANNHNLEQALVKLVARMDEEEDILFLFMSSHGKQDRGLTVNMGSYELNNITPKMIKRMLDNAGIKWRVIVISACYSGAFIEPLRDPRSLIITASAADRHSFGCGHDGEYTYFGDAYFGEHLQKEYSFITAFEKARLDIEKREQKEDLQPSLPQIVIGEEIEAKLEAFIERLKSRQENIRPLTSDGVAYIGVEDPAAGEYDRMQAPIINTEVTFQY